MLYSALVLGMMGSLHCLGMCGPLALALPGNKQDGNLQFWIRHGVYNLGRIATYAALGAVLGGLGWVLASTGFQMGLSIGAGVFLLLLLLFQSKAPLRLAPINKLSTWVQQTFVRLMGHKAGVGLYWALGLANGLLPCGLVYVALTISVWSGTALGGAAYMALFGLGTLPMMLLAGSAARLMRPLFARTLLRVVTFSIALLLIMRGLGIQNLAQWLPTTDAKASTKAKAVCH